MKREDSIPFIGGIVCGMLFTLSLMSFVEPKAQNVAPPSSQWNPAPPVPIEMNLFGEPYSPTNTPIVVDKNFNIYVYGKWVADTNGLRP